MINQKRTTIQREWHRGKDLFANSTASLRQAVTHAHLLAGERGATAITPLMLLIAVMRLPAWQGFGPMDSHVLWQGMKVRHVEKRIGGRLTELTPSAKSAFRNARVHAITTNRLTTMDLALALLNDPEVQVAIRAAGDDPSAVAQSLRTLVERGQAPKE